MTCCWKSQLSQTCSWRCYIKQLIRRKPYSRGLALYMLWMFLVFLMMKCWQSVLYWQLSITLVLPVHSLVFCLLCIFFDTPIHCFTRLVAVTNISSLYTSLCNAPQGSVLSPLFFIVYTIPLCSLISSLSSNHHLYADHTQLFFSFCPCNLYSKITHLQNALDHISSLIDS